MKLYYGPGACSLAIHCLMEEIGAPYDKQAVDLRTRGQLAPDYVAMNPKAQVPVLVRDDGSVLTELVAIAVWLAETNPQLALLPTDLDQRARLFEAMLFVSTNIHPQGFTRLGRTDKFTPNEADYEAVRAQGWKIIGDGLAWLNQSIRGDPLFLDRLSIADFSLYYAEYWAVHRHGIELGAKSAAHFAAMNARPSVQRAVAAENYPSQKR
jgi:glutathione S-transferase